MSGSIRLPAKIHNDALDGSNTFVKTDKGWIVADESPLPVKATLENIYLRRLAEVSAAPQGPWSLRALDEMGEALKRPEIRDALDLESGKDRAMSLAFTVSKARYRAQKADEAALIPLLKARTAFLKHDQGGPLPAPRHIEALLDHLDDTLVSKLKPEPGMRLRAMDSMLEGRRELGIPDWDSLLMIGVAAKVAARWREVASTISLFTALGATLVLWLMHVTLAGWLVGALAAWALVSLIVLWNTDRIDFEPATRSERRIDEFKKAVFVSRP